MIQIFKDRMKINILIFFILLLGLPFCYAIDDTKIMNEFAGIKMRYYQLQERLELNIFQARTIITKLNNYNVSTSDKQILYDYATNLTMLKNRLFLPSGELDTTTLAVDKYVAIKKEAITIVQEFRKKINEIMPAGDREELRAKLKNQEDTQLALVRKKIGEIRQEKNKIIYAEYIRILGAELKGNYLNSAISVEDARKEIRSLYSNLSDIDKQKVKERLK